MGFDEEQNEIISLSDRLDEIHGRGWYGYKGDVIARKIITLLGNHLTNYRVVGPNVYVDEHPIELDALIVEMSSSPIPGTAAYREEDIRLLIEIKKHGFYFKKRTAGEKIGEYFDRFREVGKPFVYLTVKESRTMINATSAALENDFFYLCESPNRVLAGQWERCVQRILDVSAGPNRTVRLD